MVKIITTSFGSKFHPAVERLGKQIENLNNGYVFGVVTESSIMQDKKLHFLKKFINDNGAVKNSSKGFLWYAWKPWILLRTIVDLDENEVFVYIDAGTEISIDGKKNFQKLIEFAKLNGTFFFRNPQIIRYYTKKEVLDYFQDSEIDFDKNQIAAGVIFMRNDSQTRKLLREWCRLSLHDNGALFNDNSFLNHRHDQSILSIIVQKYKFKISNYPIWFSNVDYRSNELTSYPIHTLRNPYNVSLLIVSELINKIPNRFWSLFKVNEKLYLFLAKFIFLVYRNKSNKIIWNENWERIWDVCNDDQFIDIYHCTAGDLRVLSTLMKYNFSLKILERNIMMHKTGVFKDLGTNVMYFNQYRQFGKVIDNLKIGKSDLKLKGNFVPLVSLNDNNFFHFIYDLLYKALFAKKLNKDFVCIIKDEIAWKKELLELFGLNYVVVNNDFIEVENALFVNSPIYSGEPSIEVCNILNKLAPRVFENKKLPKKVLIFRKIAKSRKIVNDDCFFELVEQGFEFVELEDLTILEQIELFQNAEIILAAHGAGLSWLFTCNSNCLVIELFSANYLNYVYARVSAKLDLDYHSFICESEYSRNRFDPDIIVSNQIINEIFSLLEKRNNKANIL